MKPTIGILLGEASGIGPETVVKLCHSGRLTDYCRPVLIGDRRILQMGEKAAGVDLAVPALSEWPSAGWDGSLWLFDLRNLDPAQVKIGEINAESGKATGDTIIAALKLCRNKVIDGFTYAPLSKAALHLGGYHFPDELNLMKHYLDWNQPSGEMNVADNLWTTRVTGHIPFKDISAHLHVDDVLRVIRMASETLTLAGFASPRIAVAALNPHAGENGACGREEIDVIIPAVEAARKQGIRALGPFPADIIFVSAFDGQYDAVVTMYHDQGQIAMKLKSHQTGVTVLAGLPYPVTTPMHGLATDIAGKGIARTDSLEQAVMIAAKMSEWNKRH